MPSDPRVSVQIHTQTPSLTDTSEAADLISRMKRLGLITTVPGTRGQRLKLRSEGERVLIALMKIKEDMDAVEG